MKIIDEKEVEKIAIHKDAEIYSNPYPDKVFKNTARCSFRDGAMSESAKAFHNKGMIAETTLSELAVELLKWYLQKYDIEDSDGDSFTLEQLFELFLTERKAK